MKHFLDDRLRFDNVGMIFPNTINFAILNGRFDFVQDISMRQQLKSSFVKKFVRKIDKLNGLTPIMTLKMQRRQISFSQLQQRLNFNIRIITIVVPPGLIKFTWA